MQTGKDYDRIIVRGKNWERRQGNKNENEINIKTDFDERIGGGDVAVFLRVRWVRGKGKKK